MDGYVAKPIQAEDLFAAIERLDFAAEPAMETETQKTDPKEIIDTASVLARVDGDMELLQEMVELFLKGLPGLLSNVQDSVKRRDAKALESAAHTLKGLVGNFGARSAFEVALQLENLGRQGDLTEAESAYRALKQEIENLKPALVGLISVEVRK